jgi:agmatine/peptidylarginine deiminase
MAGTTRTSGFTALFLLGLLLGTMAGAYLSTRTQRAPAPSDDLEESLLYAPTAPIELKGMLPETARAACVVVAMPERLLDNPRKMDFYGRFIEEVTTTTPVVVLVNREEPGAISRITQEIARRCPPSSPARSRVSFQRAIIDSEWVRDYAPLFGAGSNGRLVLLDNMYRDVRSESATERMLLGAGLVKEPGRGMDSLSLSDFGHFWRRNDDAAPMYFNEIIHARSRQLPPLVRTPLQMSGGDLCFLGTDVMLTSTRTLEINGGDARSFVQHAKDYFGIKQVLFLRPLPRGMWHLDMFLKPGETGSLLLGQIEAVGSGSLQDSDLLQEEARKVLEWNCDLLRSQLPASRIVRVPMPPLMPATTSRRGKTETGVAELDDAVAAGELRLKPQSPLWYRSFVNSLVIRSSDGVVVLIPRFQGVTDMEPEVERAYREVWPDATLHFIDADVLTEDFGGIHCVSVVLPALD